MYDANLFSTFLRFCTVHEIPYISLTTHQMTSCNNIIIMVVEITPCSCNTIWTWFASRALWRGINCWSKHFSVIFFVCKGYEILGHVCIHWQQVKFQLRTNYLLCWMYASSEPQTPSDLKLIVPPTTKLGGGGILDSPCRVCLNVCLSVVCLSVNLTCPPCSICSSAWILSIFGTNDQ